MRQYTGFTLLFLCCWWQACSPAHSIGAYTEKEFLRLPGLGSAQVGISLYDPTTAAYIYNYQGDKYFIPASNTKLFSLYAGLKYLGDSLVGMRYKITDTALLVIPSGDPTFLHPSFSSQPAFDVMKRVGKDIRLADDNWQDNAFGRGWAWDDYNDDYAAERSPFPIYGNMIRWVQEGNVGGMQGDPFRSTVSVYSVPDIDWPVRFTTDTSQKTFFVHRKEKDNVFDITEGKEKFRQQYTPFITNGLTSATLLLKDTVGRAAAITHLKINTVINGVVIPGSLIIDGAIATHDQLRPDKAGQPIPVRPDAWGLIDSLHLPGWGIVHSRPVDSLFRPMMYNSDNFFAEQTLLMVSNERLGFMKDSRIIDILLKSDLKDLPQPPNWVDGCGLSRNDWFSPRDFVWILDRLKTEFGLDRMKRILPTGGTGTLANYYRQDSGYIFAKTGSLSGVVALSGYLITKKDHLYIFSILVNNYTGNGTALRKEIEKWIHRVRDTR
ncbi:MAG TPA: D-alanyl-D-alanine carboxypeptidase [Puia sp.]|nr:D-alanyl-D-alanine carboxypeptidase [Puia sp.]